MCRGEASKSQLRTYILYYVDLKYKNSIEVFVDIVLVFGNHFVSNNSVGVEKLAMFAIRDPKKN